MQVKIKQLIRADKDKNGNAYVTKDGRPYTRVAIKTESHDDKFLSGFGNRFNAEWKVGDSVDIEIEEKNGFLNFRTATPEDRMLKELNRQATEIVSLKDRVAKLEAGQFQQDEGRSYEPENSEPLPF